MRFAQRQAIRALTALAIAAAGFGFAASLYEAWDLDTRWFIVVLVGIVGVGVAMCMVRVFSDFLLIAGFFCLPISSFQKWIWPNGYGEEERGNFVYSGLFSVGPIDFLLLGLYASWFYRIFMSREQKLPRLNWLDIFVGWYFLANLVSVAGVPDAELGLGAAQFLLKHVLFYFYLSRNLKERHLPWLLLAMVVSITIEAGLGTYQYSTGKLLGIALDKGAGGSALNYQYEVPGIESLSRATGTAYDSHSLGHFMALLLPFPLVLCFTPGVRFSVRACCVVMVGLALLTIGVSLSRAAWVSTAVALPVGIVLIVGIWQERQVVPAIAATAVVIGLAVPFVGKFIYERFADSPYETLSTRFDMYIVAWRIFQEFPVFGFGPGNWTWALAKYDFLWLPVLPIHNVILWTATEIGLFGTIPYLGMLISAIVRLFGVVRRRRDIAARLSLAALLAMLVTILNGLTDPTFRDPNVFLLFWLLAGLAVALPRLAPGAGRLLMAPPLPARGPAPARTEREPTINDHYGALP